MPLVTGGDMINTLKANPATAAMPVLILTGQWREKDVMEAFDLGVTDYMTIPFSPEELLFRVNRVLRSL